MLIALKLATADNLALLLGLIVGVSLLALNLLDDIISLDNFAKYDVGTIQPGILLVFYSSKSGGGEYQSVLAVQMKN